VLGRREQRACSRDRDIIEESTKWASAHHNCMVLL
jgi:hypothetical protein